MAQAIDQPFDAHTRRGWYADPTGRNDLRYWDGHAWTPDVLKDGREHRDATEGATASPVSQTLGFLCAVVALAGAVLLARAPVSHYAGVAYDPEGSALSATCASITSGSHWLLSPGVLVGILAAALAQLAGWSVLLRVGLAKRDRRIAGLTVVISFVALLVAGSGLDRAISFGCHTP